MTATAERQRIRSRTTLDAVVAELAERRLSRFIREAWPVVEPAATYEHNWHIDAICEKLEAVTDFEIPKLVINIPPRHMKSLAVSVFWPAWVWIRAPWRRFLYASYAEKLSIKHSVLTRRVLQSPWYQARWGERFSLASDQNVKTKFETDEGGMRLATSVGGVGTGEGGDYLVVDDPHNVNEAESERKREGVIDWWDGAMSTRVNNPLESARVLIMQRVHEEDLAGHLIEQGWEVLCLPAEYEPSHPFIWPDDPRTEEGELLWGDRFNDEWIADQHKALGSYRYAGQFQQRPSAAEGGILKKHWWRYYKPMAWPQIRDVQQSIDCAFKDLDDSDYVSVQLWARDQAVKYLLAQIRARLDITGTLAAVRALTAWATVHGFLGNHAKLVEDKANGTAVIQVLRREIPGLIPVEPQGGKEARAHAAAPEVQSGNVYLPEDIIPCPIDPGDEDVDGDRWQATPTEAFVHEAGTFPRGANDDQVDAFSQSIIRYAGRGKRGGSGKPRTGGYKAGTGSDR
jgi:predicted phage terminase large subunit-like protein